MQFANDGLASRLTECRALLGELPPLSGPDRLPLSPP